MPSKSWSIASAAAVAALFSLPAAAKPTITWQAPAPGGTLSGNVQGPPHCVVTGTDIARVMFYINDVWTNTDGNLSNGLGCWIDTTKYADGSYTLKAVAYNSKGQTATATRNIVINNPPTISWQAPAEGGALSGNVQGPPNCVVTGTNITKVMFYINGVWTNTDGNLTNGLGCWIDTTQYADGSYTLKAVAYNSLGTTTEATRNIVIANNSAGTGPAISWQAPAEGGSLSGNVQGPPNCVVTGSNIARVMFYIDGVWTNTDGNLDNGLGCWIDTTQYANGAYTLKAVAYDAAGNTAEATRGIVIQNAAPVAPIDAADILSAASTAAPFAEQSGYNVQVLGTHPSISSVAETGVHGPVLPNGETLRFGKVVDPLDSARQGLAFQVHPSDPDTSGANRTELRMPDNIEMDKVYWVALSVYVYDWGTLALEDRALFGTQIHSGDNSLGLSPSFSIYTLANGRNFKIAARWSTDSKPTPSNSVGVNYAEQPIPFGRWIDFVFKFKHNTAGAGFLQVWMDGTQIVEHQGNLGFNTPGFSDYAKFGYYNWSSEMNSARKVLLRAPTLVADPTGTKYTPEQLRAHIQGAQ